MSYLWSHILSYRDRKQKGPPKGDRLYLMREKVHVMRRSCSRSCVKCCGNCLGEPGSAAGLGRKLGLPRQRVNYHLRELEKEGLLEVVEERKKGNCVERIVRATARSYLISSEALGTLGSRPEEIQLKDAADRNAFGEGLARAVARLTAKYHDEKTPGGRRFRAFLGAYQAPAHKESQS